MSLFRSSIAVSSFFVIKANYKNYIYIIGLLLYKLTSVKSIIR